MLTDIVDLKRLRSFHLVATHGNLRAAATNLLLSTSAISIQIKQLEDELGVRLFRRVGRRFILEPAGQDLLPQVTAILDALRNAVMSVSAGGRKDRITIAMRSDLTRLFAPTIGEFLQANPTVEIALQHKTSREALSNLLEGNLDMAIGYFSKVPKGLRRRIIVQSGFSMSYGQSHPIASCPSPSIKDLARYPIISMRPETDIGRRIVQAFTEANLEPKTFLETGNCQSSQELAAQGIGIAFTHTACLGREKASRMSSIDVTWLLGQVDVTVVFRRYHSLPPSHRDLLDRMGNIGRRMARSRDRRTIRTKLQT